MIVTSMSIRLTLSAPHVDMGTTTTTTCGPIRVSLALVLDRQCNGASPSASDIWAQDLTLSHLNMANSHRFKIIKKWDTVLNAVAVDQDPLSTLGS